MTKTAVPHFSGILGSDAFPIEAARYRLIWSEICPWSQRVAILRRLLGLEDIISEGKVNPVITEKGWQFSLLRLGPGTLYGSIKRLRAGGLIEESGERPD